MSYQVKELEPRSWRALLEFSGPTTVFYLGDGIEKEEAKQKAARYKVDAMVFYLGVGIEEEEAKQKAARYK